MSRFKLDNESKVIFVLKENRANMSADDNAEINFYIGLGYKINFVEKYPKAKKKSFTENNAIEYIKVNDKKNLKTFTDFKTEADKLSAELSEITTKYRDTQNKLWKDKQENKLNEEEINKVEKEIEKLKTKKDELRNKQLSEQRKAFTAQRKYFKETYGEDVYKAVLEMK